MNGEVRSEGGGFDGVSSRDLWAVRNAAYQKEKGARKGGGGGGGGGGRGAVEWGITINRSLRVTLG